ncbi:MAG: hypothetical protein ACK5ZS_01550 [bacterium]|jgi:hypothetical protein
MNTKPQQWLGLDAGPLFEQFRDAQMTDQQRLERKRQAAIDWLGERWILHPLHRVQRVVQS